MEQRLLDRRGMRIGLSMNGGGEGFQLRPLRRTADDPILLKGRRILSPESAFLTLEMLGNVPRPEMNCADAGHAKTTIGPDFRPGGSGGEAASMGSTSLLSADADAAYYTSLPVVDRLV